MSLVINEGQVINIDKYNLAVCIDGPKGKGTRLALVEGTDEARQALKSEHSSIASGPVLEFNSINEMKDWLGINLMMVLQIKNQLRRTGTYGR